jgi:hypothetical protein
MAQPTQERPESEPEEIEEYPAGTELPTEPPGVDEDSEDEQPGLLDDPPQAD